MMRTPINRLRNLTDMPTGLMNNWNFGIFAGFTFSLILFTFAIFSIVVDKRREL